MKNETTNKVVIRNSLRGGFRKTLWRIFIVLVLAGLAYIGVFMILHSDGFAETIFGAVLAICFGGAGCFKVYSMIKGTVVVTISDKGIDVADETFVPWEHVQGIEHDATDVFTQVLLGVHTDDDDHIKIEYYKDGDVEKSKSISFDSEYSPYTNEEIVKILGEFYERYKGELGRALPGRAE